MAMVIRVETKSAEENPRRIVPDTAWRYVAIRIYLVINI